MADTKLSRVVKQHHKPEALRSALLRYYEKDLTGTPTLRVFQSDPAMLIIEAEATTASAKARLYNYIEGWCDRGTETQIGTC